MSRLQWTEDQLAAYRQKHGQTHNPSVSKPPAPAVTPGRVGEGRIKGTRRVEVDGMRFDSKVESAYYMTLKIRQRSPDDPLLYFLRQVPIHLRGGVRYVVDFLEFYADRKPRYVDVKGHETEMFKTKKRLVEASYPIVIDVVKRGDF